MASWYFREVFAHPRVAGLDFYARLDTDSKITSPIRYDLFAFMRDNGFSYGCVIAWRVHGPCRGHMACLWPCDCLAWPLNRVITKHQARLSARAVHLL